MPALRDMTACVPSWGVVWSTTTVAAGRGCGWVATLSATIRDYSYTIHAVGPQGIAASIHGGPASGRRGGCRLGRSWCRGELLKL